jgi:hypothetical protein
MKPKNNIAEDIWFNAAHKIVPIVVLLAFAFSGMILIQFLKNHKVSNAENYGGILIVLAPLGWYYSKTVLYIMQADDKLTFWDACVSAYFSLILYLHFIPLIGPMLRVWAQNKKEKKNPFVLSDPK